MKIAVTGHRPNKLNNEYDMDGPHSEHIRNELQEAINALSPTLMISGLALGVDTIWALLAVKNNIPLMAVIPFPSQDKIWTRDSRKIYQELLEYAKNTGGIKCTGTDPFEAWKMDVRNRYMVDNCDLLIAVYNGDQSGGTYNCLKYAEKISKSLLKINPKPKTHYYEGLSESDKRSIEEVERLWDI